MNKTIFDIELSDEQQHFIDVAKSGKSILVDACIGSGKTTTIQYLCRELPDTYNILYLTYNRLLKVDAKAKIKNPNVTVQNYHGFAYKVLRENKKSCGISDSILKFNELRPNIDRYDVLILDEYQDIDLEISEMLDYIKSVNAKIQIVAVGDMAQKIYDKTTLDIISFIDVFLGDHVKMTFSKCFRLSAEYADKLGRIWNKKIIGVNENCIIEEMDTSEAVDFLVEQNPGDVLCLGARLGRMTSVLNKLESDYPEKFNKKTVYASIRDSDSLDKASPKKTSAIFTTYDSSKGLERKFCVLFDYTESYWRARVNNPHSSYEILRNIFCVAASRGKNRIILVKESEELLSEKTLKTKVRKKIIANTYPVSKMFDFKYKENVEKCFSLLKVVDLNRNKDSDEIYIKSNDGLIDLSMCIGTYQEAVFFDNFDIDEVIKWERKINEKVPEPTEDDMKSLDSKILYHASIETGQNRYRTQVNKPFVSDYERRQLVERLGEVFATGEKVQKECSLEFLSEFCKKGKCIISGFADVVKDDIVYELKFVSELTHEHFLQCACYIVALGLEKGRLWNTRDNSMYEISVPDKKAFLDAVVETITKGMETAFIEPKKTMHDENRDFFAVLDVETNNNDKVMSIGVVIAGTNTMEPVFDMYYIITPECYVQGMYSSALNAVKERQNNLFDRSTAMENVVINLKKYGVRDIFAYCAHFDCIRLPELKMFSWYDIALVAAYKQYNRFIPQNAECFKTGRLKRGYKVEDIMHMLTSDMSYVESHNALLDAKDELKIMRLLGHPITFYDIAHLSKTVSSNIAIDEVSAQVIATEELNIDAHKSIEGTKSRTIEFKAYEGVPKKKTEEKSLHLNLNNSLISTDDKDVNYSEIAPSVFGAKDDDYLLVNEEKEKKGCYIATAVYGSYDCPKVWTLRRYRDFYLSRNMLGRLFIKLYYRVSPQLVRKYGKATWFITSCRRALDRFVSVLNKKGIKNTPYYDK